MPITNIAKRTYILIPDMKIRIAQEKTTNNVWPISGWTINKREITVVMDADALNLLTKLKLSAKLPKNLIITPHPGEASRLLNKSIDEIESNRFKAVSLLQEKYNCVAVLKGSGTLVCYKKGGKQKIGICEAGNPGMASGGMGYILTE